MSHHNRAIIRTSPSGNMKRSWMVGAIIFLAATLQISTMIGQAATPEERDFAILEKVWVKGNRVLIRTDKPTPYNVFKVSSPDRLVIELTNTENDWKKKEIKLRKNDYFSKVRAGQFQNEPVKIARVVIELKGPVEFETDSDDTTIVLTAVRVATEEEELSEEGAAWDPEIEPVSMAAAPTPPETLESVQDAEPEARDVSAAPETAAPEIEATAEPPVAEEPAAQMASKKMAEPAAEAAASAATTESPTTGTKSDAGSIDLAALPVAPAPTQPVMSKSIVKERKPRKIRRPLEPSTLFGTQPVTLDFYDIDVKDLFKILAEKSGVNVVFGSLVGGTISIQLRDVSFKEAVDTILALKDLRMVVMGKNIVQLMTPTEFDKYRTSAISVTKIFPINYAAASDVNNQLIAIFKTLGGKGKTLVDDRTNSIIVTDTPDGIEITTKLIVDLDKPAPQVMIEAKIVQVTLGRNLDLGITWGVSYTDQSGNQMFTLGASRAQDPQTPIVTPGSGGFGLQDKSPLNPSGGSFAELGGTGFTAGQGLGLAFGFVKDMVRLNAALNALQQNNRSKLLSNPKIATLNNMPATIKSETREPYITTETTLVENAGVTTAQKVNQAISGINLTVTPTINADGRITLKIVPDITSSVPTSIGIPKTTSQRAETTVIVRDGETFVIGGLITEVETDEKSFVPVLGKIPLLGHLFKKTSKTKLRSELLIFVTPTIIPY